MPRQGGRGSGSTPRQGMRRVKVGIREGTQHSRRWHRTGAEPRRRGSAPNGGERDMTISRRSFLKGAGAAGWALLGGARARAATSAGAAGDVEFNGMLIDTTMCIGCRACEAACNEVNHLPKPKVDLYSDAVFAERRDTTPDAFTVLNRFPARNPEESTFVRRQCMHCNQPGCASACLVKALEKTKEGAVIYNKDRCMGCRYCMIACPFEVPKEPDKYHPHIYGEHEVGGTGWLFLAGVAPQKLGLPENLGTTPYPELTAGFLYGVPLVFVLWPSILFGLNSMVKGEDEEAKSEERRVGK